jgi:ADP-ribosylglycohydrolase
VTEKLDQVWRRRRAATDALEGLSVGDSFGEQFFGSRPHVEAAVARRQLPPPPWRWTDDTNMAVSILEVLVEKGRIDQDELARSFARRYDPRRGYGAAMHGVLRAIRAGRHWECVAGSQFGGQGSYGNGAAMRVAPLGPWFGDDLEGVVDEARRSAAVTHAHPEASAGAIAVSVAAAVAFRSRGQPPPRWSTFLDQVREHTPPSEVAERLGAARRLAPDATVGAAVGILGNGADVSAQDTVPFAVWSAAHELDDFEGALWRTVSGLGDRDTTCAIVGGIVAARVGAEGIPRQWRENREPLAAPAVD